MQLNLTAEEEMLAKRILTEYLSDLRMEIRDTEDYELREGMKRDEALIRGIIDRLSQIEKVQEARA